MVVAMVEVAREEKAKAALEAEAMEVGVMVEAVGAPFREGKEQAKEEAAKEEVRVVVEMAGGAMVAEGEVQHREDTEAATVVGGAAVELTEAVVKVVEGVGTAVEGAMVEAAKGAVGTVVEAMEEAKADKPVVGMVV